MSRTRSASRRQRLKPEIVRITPDEFQGVVHRAERERWTQLAIVGAAVPLPAQDDWSRTWASRLCAYQRLYQLATPAREIARQVASAKYLTAAALIGLDLDGEATTHLSQLTELTALDLSSNELGDEWAPHLLQLKELTALNLRGNKLGDGGAAHLSQLTGLTTLNLAYNRLGPDGAACLSQLVGLTSLNLRGNKLGAGGAAHLSPLTGLTTLDLGYSTLGDEGAAHLSPLTGLTTLNLWANMLGDEGAAHLSQLTRLTTLDLGHNKLGNAGAAHLSQLTGLTTLDLGHNHLSDEGAAHVSQLTGLTTLDLSNNQLGDEGAAHVSQLTGLTTLDLSNNQLGDEGAAHLSQLTGLATLDLSNNQLGDEGAAHLSRLTGLATLDLSNNHLGGQGAMHVSQLTGLTTLDLSNNQLGDEGVAHLSQLTGLTALNLWGNTLGADGAKHLSQLTGLTTLDLSNNRLGAEGATHLSELAGLTTLDLSNNQLGDAGVAHLSQLTGLTALDLSNNQLGDEGAAHLSRMTGLTTLDLSNNQLGDEGGAHLSRVTGLTTLDLSSNELGVEGATHLSKLAGLTTLNLSGSEVVSLAPVRALLERGLRVSTKARGHGLLLKNCPLVHPPPEVVEQGRRAVLNYFRELDKQGVARLFEAKVLIVGKGQAGKTSLLRRLYQPELPLPSVEETTRGIDIHQHSFGGSEGQPFRLNVWDFGGQQIYHATHQFFLTKSALYILVDDTKEDAKSVHDDYFKSWLERVEVFGGSSPVLIFQNEKGGRSKAIDEAGIKGRYPNVIDVYRGNLEEPNSAEGLRRAIEHLVQELPNVGQALPAQWVEIRQAIETRAKTSPFISQNDYFALYAEHLELDRDKALHLSRFLHDLGVCLHFQDDRRLRDTVVLQNEWATEAVFRVLDDEQVKLRQGRFSSIDCDRIWGGCEWEAKQGELLSLMEKFELCYPLRDTEPEQWLLPQLLSPSAPRGLNKEACSGDLVREYRYEFLPRGMVNRLMVRMHRFVRRPELAWASGALFERGGTLVLVSTAPNGQEIHLRARGPERKELLSVVASDLDALNDSFVGLKDRVDTLVPCCCEQCARSANPELFSERKLRRRREMGKLEIECDQSFQRVSVLHLLDGLDVRELLADQGFSKGEHKQGGGIHFHREVTFQGDSAILFGDQPRLERHAEPTASFAGDLEAIRVELLTHQEELGETLAEALGNVLRLLAQSPTPSASTTEARLKELEDEQFLRETLPQLRNSAFDWDGVVRAAKVAGDTAKAIAPLMKWLSA